MSFQCRLNVYILPTVFVFLKDKTKMFSVMKKENNSVDM